MEKLSIIERTVDYQERIEENVYLQSDVDELALKLWQQYATGESSDELLSQALQNEGLTINSACSKIKVLDAYAAINREDNLWLKDIEAIIEKYKVGFDSIAGLFDSKGALELCIYPLILQTRNKVKLCSKSWEKYISSNAMEEYCDLLREKVIFIAENVLLTCARSYERSFDVSYWKEPFSGGEAQNFLEWFYSQGMEKLFKSYPLLMKKIITCMNIHCSNFEYSGGGGAACPEYSYITSYRKEQKYHNAGNCTNRGE